MQIIDTATVIKHMSFAELEETLFLLVNTTRVDTSQEQLAINERKKEFLNRINKNDERDRAS